jgi:hypothetical protein
VNTLRTLALAAALAAAGLGGCEPAATRPGDHPDGTVTRPEVGMTKADVLARWGQPDERIIDDGRVAWRYERPEAIYRLEFDDDTVVRYTAREQPE